MQEERKKWCKSAKFCESANKDTEEKAEKSRKRRNGNGK